MRNHRLISLTSLLVLTLCVAQASADYREVLSAGSLFGAVQNDTPTILGGSINDGATTSYHVVKRSSPSNSWIVKVENFDSGAPSMSVLTPWSGNLNMGRGLGLAGNDIVLGDGTTDSVYKVNATTGAITTYVTKAELLAQTGGDALQGNSSYVRPDGELIFLETDTDAVYVTAGASTVNEFLSQEALANSQGVSLGSGTVSSQIDFIGDLMYYGANSSDALYAYDPMAPAPTPGDNISTVLNQSDITTVTGSASAGFGDLIYNDADGLVYFRETVSRSFLSFDPTDPVNTLTTVLSRTQLEDGPAGTTFTIGPASLIDGEFAWSSNPNGYYTIPEPSALILLGLATLMVRRR